MQILILSLVLLGIILLVVTYLQRRNKPQESEVVYEPLGECCGAHEVCEQDSLLSAENVVVYFDDEELDEMADTPPGNYTKEQMEQLSDVFFTLKESEVSAWLRSLQMRRIQLPIELREQALMIVSERRAN